jgi:hypothetical protein
VHGLTGQSQRPCDLLPGGPVLPGILHGSLDDDLGETPHVGYGAESSQGTRRAYTVPTDLIFVLPTRVY